MPRDGHGVQFGIDNIPQISVLYGIKIYPKKMDIKAIPSDICRSASI